jgi:hypothetical protein
VAGRSKSGLQLRWTTVSYSSVFVALLVLALLAGFVWYLLSPNTFRSGTDVIGSLIRRGLEKVAGSSQANAVNTGPQQAKFTNIEGVVKVRKANSNVYVAAEYNLPLERGDVVQTGSEGMAKVAFADGTNYTVKPDSLIVVEENSTNAAQQTQVAVQLTTGTVDLATGTYVQGSKSQVIVSGATASLAPETAAMVYNNPRADQHQILAKKGTVDVTRGTETLRLGGNEMASFSSASHTMTRTKQIAPPTLISPANMAPVFGSKGTAPVEFSWSQVDTAVGYRLRVSKNPFFSSFVLDKRVSDLSFNLPALPEGAYYWYVSSVDINGKESTESEHNRFTVIPKGAESASILLELEPLMQHGHIIEVKGRTEPNAKVMVNGKEAVDVRPDGSFSAFTTELPSGENVITITAQNARGGVRTKQQKVVIQ